VPANVVGQSPLSSVSSQPRSLGRASGPYRSGGIADDRRIKSGGCKRSRVRTGHAACASKRNATTQFCGAQAKCFPERPPRRWSRAHAGARLYPTLLRTQEMRANRLDHPTNGFTNLASRVIRILHRIGNPKTKDCKSD
jgi:hypothetical protein